MNNANEQWVALPNLKCLTHNNLKYPDALIYISIRYYLNSKDKRCFPSRETIASRAGVSKDYVDDSINRLTNAGIITVKRSKRCTELNNPNQYGFKSFNGFEQIPYSFFKVMDLTKYEKGMLLCIRQYFNHGGFSTLFSYTQIANNLGVSHRTVHSQMTKLIDKGYITKEHDGFTLTDKIVWIDGFAKLDEVVKVEEPSKPSVLKVA